MSDVPGGDSDASPNLTPILDMVFQLITFFMLVINFKSAALDMSLRLPVMGSAKMVDSQGTNDILVLNIDKEGKLKQYGSAVDVKAYVAKEANVSKLAAKAAGMSDEDIEADGVKTVVVIRADEDTTFHALNQVLKECQDGGFRSFALRAMNRAD